MRPTWPGMQSYASHYNREYNLLTNKHRLIGILIYSILDLIETTSKVYKNGKSLILKLILITQYDKIHLVANG